MTASVTAFYYDPAGFMEVRGGSVAECLKDRPSGSTAWINIDGLDPGEIQFIGDHLGVHPLLLEDISNTEQRPKIDEYDGYVFLILKMLTVEKGTLEVAEEQVSVLLTQSNVVTFQEKEGDVFDAVRDRIRGDKGSVRKLGTDYLVYLLIDAVVDHYFDIMEILGDRIEQMEEELVEKPTTKTIKELHHIRRQMITVRRSVWPLRGVLDLMERCGNEVISDSAQIYFRDVYDHTVQLIDAVETNRDLVGGILDAYLTSVNNRMNEVMKFLTIIGTIFIPLSFIASVYGMNFRYMPELEQWWAYPALWLVMIGVAALMVYYFRRKDWI